MRAQAAARAAALASSGDVEVVVEEEEEEGEEEAVEAEEKLSGSSLSTFVRTIWCGTAWRLRRRSRARS